MTPINASLLVRGDRIVKGSCTFRVNSVIQTSVIVSRLPDGEVCMLSTYDMEGFAHE